MELKTWPLEQHEDIEAVDGAGRFLLFQLLCLVSLLSTYYEDLAGPVEQQAPKAAVKRKVMISYCWNEKDLAQRVHQAIEGCGHTVWRDKEKVQSAPYREIAKAIEECDVIVCIASLGYKNSGICEAELCYARDKNKKTIPLLFENSDEERVLENWLGLILSPFFYYDVSNPTKEKDGIARMTHTLEHSN